MEPPVVRSVAACLDHRVTLKAAHDLVSHYVDAVTAPHTLRAVEVKLVQLARIEDARDAVGQFIGQRRVRLGIEGDVTLLQIIGLITCGMSRRLCSILTVRL